MNSADDHRTQTRSIQTTGETVWTKGFDEIFKENELQKMLTEYGVSQKEYQEAKNDKEIAIKLSDALDEIANGNNNTIDIIVYYISYYNGWEINGIIQNIAFLGAFMRFLLVIMMVVRVDNKEIMWITIN